MNIEISKQSRSKAREVYDSAELLAAESVDQALSAAACKVPVSELLTDFGLESAEFAELVGHLRGPSAPRQPNDAFVATLETRLEEAFEARPVPAEASTGLASMGLRWRGWSVAGACATALGLAAFFVLSGLGPANTPLPPTSVAATHTATVPTPEAMATDAPGGIEHATHALSLDRTMAAATHLGFDRAQGAGGPNPLGAASGSAVATL